jgi:CubicO group peptidase (beta-lactamase class C family)
MFMRWMLTGTALLLLGGAAFASPAGSAVAKVVPAESASPPADLDAYATRAMKTFGVPGMAIAIVDGARIDTRGYGIRKLGSPARVDADTTFPIGSNTKAFTSTALAILVDEGKLGWNDRVVDRLPGFRMYDAYASQNMTITDLLVHRSGLGLGEGDLMVFPDTDRTRAELVHSIRYLKPVTSFRKGFAYDNVLYSVAGQLVQAVSGQTWESFIKQHIFAPLGMRDATVTYQAQGPDRAAPHARISEALRGMGPQTVLPTDGVSRPIAPAGAICASANDMGRWLRVQLDHGAMGDGKRLFSAAQSNMLWTPVTVVPIRPAPAPIAATTPDFAEYALGFFVTDYRGHKIITHEGGVLGGLSEVVIIPDKHVAFAVMINSEDAGAMLAVFYHLLDHYVDAPSTDWIARYRQLVDQRQAAALKALHAGQVHMHPQRGPSLPLKAYAGVYRDPWYGSMTISDVQGKLRIRFDRSPGMEGALEHAQYDTFRTHWSDRDIEDAWVTFDLNPDGSIAAIRMKPVSPTADFSWDYQDLHFVPDKGAGDAAD